MTQIAPQILAFTKASSLAEEMFRTIDQQSEINPLSEEGQVPMTCIGDIKIENVSFAYPARPDITVLNGLQLSAPANKTTALVGASGSRKSTIIGLLKRWYNQSSGTIFLDGIDIQELKLHWLRTSVRLVQQEPVLFAGTVYDNVAYGLFGTPKVDLPEPEQRALVEKACKDAYAVEFIERLPKGYDTELGERAINLSGGQKQRLAIARSIVSEPRVLLLDEATSALDPNAEKIVQQALDRVSKNRTTIVIAHKLSTIRNADNIAVMADGAVVEQGTHNDLLAHNGAHSRLVRAQDLGDAGAEDDESMREKEGDTRMELVRTQTQTSEAPLQNEPRLLLLDEATSALDTESEKIVQAALEKAKSGRTTIAVAHRLSTIKDADCIIVFVRGMIVESGTHKYLLAKRGVYYEMSLGQSLNKQILT
ncbi:P-loop containing nucleoside triphosphate hydrolase protein [Didymella exigua CBS 183.55]|uniref:P-loop containing nucleoside triphosphate hydrolase protein n=1 Tax=Didymella exigua CBS 183.55 TaxID=1150837 RepID=A0A6A5R935_9PLEO|nr:P-loop containing nucleoside triphosphate hydrolase protein [Didymella exigua CBS 183.55]KAF1923514.1 P-loop containing nucleoside triphosphate hydrolase protein [Didymella exigua CBS 183.55]